MDRSVLFLVIKRRFAEAILAGTKRFDLRVSPIHPYVRYALMYVAEEQQVIGGFTISQVIKRRPDALWNVVGEQATTKERFFDYFRNAESATAIGVSSAEAYREPISLAKLRALDKGFFVPPSFGYLSISSPVAKFVAGLAPQLKSLGVAVQQKLSDMPVAPAVADLNLTPAHDEDRKQFAELCATHIGAAYDQIDETFAGAIWHTYKRGHDANGYFTLGKQVYRIELLGHLAGFIVTTEKRGGSIKYGPTLLLPDFQRKGIAVRVRNLLDDRHRDEGFRKAYSTTPSTNLPAVKYLLKCGYRIEAHLGRQYTERHDELVFGKLLAARNSPVESPDSDPRASGNFEISWTIPDAPSFATWLLQQMRSDYDGLDESFVNNILTAATNYTAGEFQSKGKIVATAIRAGELVAAIICTPKRGGSAKLAPFLSTMPVAETTRFLDQVLHALDQEHGIRRTYVIAPLHDGTVHAAALSTGHQPEGCLIEPYAPGVDVMVFGKVA